MISIDELIELESKLYNVKKIARPPITLHLEAYKNMPKELENKFRAFEISKEEAFIVILFTGFSSTEFNNQLSRKTLILNDLQRKVIEYFDSILFKIPSFEGNLLYRMDKVGDKANAKKWYSERIGRIISIPWFLSTSTDNYDNTEIIWRIKPLHSNLTKAHSLYEIVNHGNENEVRYERNVCFKVEGCQFEKEKLFVDLTETENLDCEFEKLIQGKY